ncbi:MAG: hypothetical protein LBR85_00700, partial [Oscillospiraceae bacterium]|nr:hypothetical protein [Oscillospiraceae bacterium]
MKKRFFALIITGVAVVFFAGGLLAGRFIEKPLYLYARVLELREDTLSVEAAYNDGPRRLYGQLELFISNP